MPPWWAVPEVLLCRDPQGTAPRYSLLPANGQDQKVEDAEYSSRIRFVCTETQRVFNVPGSFLQNKVSRGDLPAVNNMEQKGQKEIQLPITQVTPTQTFFKSHSYQQLITLPLPLCY